VSASTGWPQSWGQNKQYHVCGGAHGFYDVGEHDLALDSSSRQEDVRNSGLKYSYAQILCRAFQATRFTGERFIELRRLDCYE
jgi:hypothetical protein